MSSRVLDVGAGPNPDPRADITADKLPDVGADAVFDAETDEWPFSDGAVSGIIARHVVEHLERPEAFFREAARVLEDDGWIEVTVPIGASAFGDPDHQHRWVWVTPEVWSEQHRRAWDPEVPLQLVHREVDANMLPPLHHLTPVAQWLADRWPAWAAYRAPDGELTARYRRMRR